MKSSRIKAYILLLIVAVIWGLAEPIIKFTLGGFSPLIFLTYRFAISSIIAVMFFIKGKFSLPKGLGIRLEILLYAFVTSSLSLGLLFFGMDKTTVLDTVLITVIAPLITSFAGVKFLKEHVTKQEIIGMSIALIGTVLIVIEPLIRNHEESIRLSGNIIILLYLFTSTWGAILAKKIMRKGADPLTITNISFVVGFITFLPFALPQLLSNIQVLTSPILPYHLGVWYMAILSGTFAYFLSNKAQKTIEIGEAAVFNYLYPLIAAPPAVLWLGEKITSTFIVGAVIIAVGVVIAEFKKRRYN